MVNKLKKIFWDISFQNTIFIDLQVLDEHLKMYRLDRQRKIDTGRSIKATHCYKFEKPFIKVCRHRCGPVYPDLVQT